MGKIITVTGHPCCGKSVISLKLAQEIYGITKKRVIILSPDINNPILGFLFPHRKEEELYSLGKILDKTDVYRDDVLKNIVTFKKMRDFGYLGYKLGENRYSYPEPTADKIYQFISCLKEIADYIIADGTNDDENLISAMARAEAKSAIQLITPELKCVTYYASHPELLTFPKADTVIKVMNIKEKDMYLPTCEVERHFSNVKYILPYSFELSKQAVSGTLPEKLSDDKFRKVLTEAAKAVIE